MTVIEQFISHVKSSSQVNIDRAIKTLLTSDIDRNWTDTGDLCGTNLWSYCSYRISLITTGQAIPKLQASKAIKFTNITITLSIQLLYGHKKVEK